MPILKLQEKDFLDVYLYEATTEPFFRGPASKALFAIGVGYHDISELAWAYQEEVPMTWPGWGRPADVAPLLPWPNREAVRLRNDEIQRIREKRQKLAPAPNA
jgi:hypothetical protein